jgi:hypothetical protein
MASLKWNLRVVRTIVNGEEHFAFHEVEQEFEAGEPHAIHAEPFDTGGRNVKQLYDKLRHMLGAINQPVLELDSLPRADE